MNPSDCSTVPPAIMSASQAELDDLVLNVVEGQIPADIHGHVFMVAPVGSVDSNGLPYPDGDALLNGDGMVYRLDFNCSEKVSVKTRIVKPPDYYADKATALNSKYKNLHFRNHGIARFSFKLGLRNQLNTAFLPMKFQQDESERLLVTYDAGRPYEIDPQTLEVATPIGANCEWQGELDNLKLPFLNATKFPFKSILSTAHPAFDYSGEGKLFSVNYSRSANNFLAGINWIYQIEQLPAWLESILAATLDFFLPILTFIFSKILRFLNRELVDFTDIISWDGRGDLERWRLVLADGTPVKIEQTIHQIGVTQDYVILMDTAFIMGIEQVLNNPFPNNKKLEKRLRKRIERPPLPDSVIYIVRRQDLTPLNSTVVAQKVSIPLEAAHFLVDYENPNNQITLHVAHLCGMQVAEWLREYDVAATPPHNPVPPYLRGMEHNETDIGRMGRYIIDGETGEILNSQVISDTTATWAVDLYAYQDRTATGAPLGKLENVYWGSFGLWRDLMTQYICDLYRDYKYRLIPLSEAIQYAQNGRPACLFRLHTPSMTLADCYQFPCGHMALSPQFIPRGDESESTQGYITCAVCFDNCNEIWIFDASHLAQGPLCRLQHEKLNFGFTLHTTWLRKIAPRSECYSIPVKLDYQYLVEQNDSEVQALFSEEVYPHFS